MLIDISYIIHFAHFMQHVQVRIFHVYLVKSRFFSLILSNADLFVFRAVFSITSGLDTVCFCRKVPAYNPKKTGSFRTPPIPFQESLSIHVCKQLSIIVSDINIIVSVFYVYDHPIVSERRRDIFSDILNNN